MCVCTAGQASVFKSVEKKREEVRGAEEVAEDESTAVELPVDQVVTPRLHSLSTDIHHLLPSTPFCLRSHHAERLNLEKRQLY